MAAIHPPTEKARFVNLTGGHPYLASRDYAWLFTALETTPIVCFVNYLECRDVAATALRDQYHAIGARGISYVEASTLEDFVEQCRKLEVEFLRPGGPGRDEFQRVKDAANEACELARTNRLDCCANLAAIGCIDAMLCFSENGEAIWQIEIDEAAPDDTKLHTFIRDQLQQKGFRVIVKSEW